MPNDLRTLARGVRGGFVFGRVTIKGAACRIYVVPLRDTLARVDCNG